MNSLRAGTARERENAKKKKSDEHEPANMKMCIPMRGAWYTGIGLIRRVKSGSNRMSSNEKIVCVNECDLAVCILHYVRLQTPCSHPLHKFMHASMK